MRTIIYIIQKEFTQIFRNKSMLPIIFIMPIIQLLILVNAATFEIKNIKMYIVDTDLSQTSRQLVTKFQSSPFFIITNNSFSVKDAEESVMKGKSDVIFRIPINFERDLFKYGTAKVEFDINAINAMVAGLTNAYATNVVNDFNKDLINKNVNIISTPYSLLPTQNINVTYSHWFNPELIYINFMVPGVLVLLITIIAIVLSGMNIVREKEIGTIEQINVTPIKKHQFIIGKLLPFWIIALFELAFGLTIGKLVFHIPTVGSIPLLFFAASVYLLVILGLGLFISTLANTQQQAMFVTFFFNMIFILMSGLFTPIENMPNWAQILDRLNPIAYFIRITRMILLKGSGFHDISPDFYSLLVLAIIMLLLADWRYRKTT